MPTTHRLVVEITMDDDDFDLVFPASPADDVVGLDMLVSAVEEAIRSDVSQRRSRAADRYISAAVHVRTAAETGLQ